jgi:phospholipid transport system transporter-binding protein
VSTARIEALGAGRFRVSGVLNAITVIDLLKQSRERFKGATRLEVDLGAVAESDSAGLALLLEWLRMAREAGQQIHYASVPAQISALARISEVDDLLNTSAAAGSAGAADVSTKASGEPTPLTPKTQTA